MPRPASPSPDTAPSPVAAAHPDTVAHPDTAADPSPAAAPPDAEAGAPSRRTVMTMGASAAVALAGAAPLAACSSSSSSSAGGAAGTVLAPLSGVPVGGAIEAHGPSQQAIVIAQPTAGTVVAFSAICTHQGCTVAVSGTRLNCPCHGSEFNALTGAVLQGPATRALPAVKVKISGSNVVSA